MVEITETNREPDASFGAVSAEDSLTLPVYSTFGDVPTDLPEGTLVWVADENTVYKETGT